MITELFQQALNINTPWFIKSVDFNADKKQLDIHVDFKRGTTFADPEASGETAKEYKAYDTVQKTWRHLTILNMNVIYMRVFLALNGMMAKYA